MEDVAEAMALAENSNAVTETRPSQRENIPAAPSNYAWPRYEATESSEDRGASHRLKNLRHERTEHREKYRAWELEKVSRISSPRL
jgi:hypothetical protein